MAHPLGQGSYNNLTRKSSEPGQDQPRAEEAGLQKVLSDANKMNHLFGKAKHAFDPLVDAIGSQEALVEQMFRGLQGEIAGAGRFTVERLIGNATVHMDATTLSGVPRLSTAWVVQ